MAKSSNLSTPEAACSYLTSWSHHKCIHTRRSFWKSQDVSRPWSSRHLRSQDQRPHAGDGRSSRKKRAQHKLTPCCGECSGRRSAQVWVVRGHLEKGQAGPQTTGRTSLAEELWEANGRRARHWFDVQRNQELEWSVLCRPVQLFAFFTDKFLSPWNSSFSSWS